MLIAIHGRAVIKAIRLSSKTAYHPLIKIFSVSQTESQETD